MFFRCEVRKGIGNAQAPPEYLGDGVLLNALSLFTFLGDVLGVVGEATSKDTSLSASVLTGVLLAYVGALDSGIFS